MDNPCIMGCDPGNSGAVAFYFPKFANVVSVRDVPLVDGQIDSAALGALIDQFKPDLALVELVGARPGQGVTSMFRFGVAFGRLTGVISSKHIPLHYVTPGKWKKHFRLSAEKEEARDLAIRLWPASDLFRRKKDHGRAEAALIAKYAAEVLIPAVAVEAAE
jgi:hypothetical protein